MQSVALFSGGMDSLIMVRMFKPEVALRVSVGSRYDSYEREVARRLVAAGFLGSTEYKEETPLHLGDLEQPGGVVPLRNTYFVLLGSLHGDRVMLASTFGDNIRDKDDVFAQLMGSLLTYLARDAHYDTPRRRVEVCMPYRNMTKAEMVKAYLDQGHPIDALIQSFSCYTPSEGKHCGNCLPCVRRYVAFAVNGHDGTGDYVQDPRRSPYGREAVERALRGHRGKEDRETLTALRSTDG